MKGTCSVVNSKAVSDNVKQSCINLTLKVLVPTIDELGHFQTG